MIKNILSFFKFKAMEEQYSKKNILTHDSADVWVVDTDYSYSSQIAISYLATRLNILAITLCQRTPKENMELLKKKVESDLKKISKETIKVFIGADRAYIDYVADLKDEEFLDPYNFYRVNTHNSDNNLHHNSLEHPGAHANKHIKKPEDIDSNNISEFIANIAAVKIAELIKAHGQKLNILCLGPLTNLSLAIVLDHSIKDAFKNLYIIGGSIYNYDNSGNNSEYNFRVDPVAAKNVILNYKNITLLSLELDLKLKDHKKELLNELSEIDLDSANTKENKTKFFIGKFEDFVTSFKYLYEKSEDDKDFYRSLFPFTAILLILFPEILSTKHVKKLPCDVDIFGRKTRGGLMIQHYEHLQNGKFNDVNLINDYEIKEYLRSLKELLTEFLRN